MPLTGPALLSKVDELNQKGANKTMLARETGYVSTTTEGKVRTNFTGFYEALLQAKGALHDQQRKGRPGRPLSYRTKVLSGVGHVVVGARYLAEIGATEGQVLQIRISRGRITLEPAPDDQAGED
jgi:hypothetical protein